VSPFCVDTGTLGRSTRAITYGDLLRSKRYAIMLLVYFNDVTNVSSYGDMVKLNFSLCLIY
jgi:hypothetical protein